MTTNTPNVAITVSARTLLKVLLFILGTILAIAALRRASHAIILVFTAVFLAFSLNGPVSWVARHLPRRQRGSRPLATALLALLIIVLVGAFLTSLISPITSQTETLIKNAPHLIRQVQSSNSPLGKLIVRYHLEKQVDTLSSQLSSRLKEAGGSAFTTVTKIGSSIFSMLTIIVLTFMMLIEGPRWLRFIRDTLPSGRRKYANQLARDMYKVIKGYVNGQVLLALIAAFMILPGLIVFHVSYPIALMAIIFVCGLIPMVGHTIGAVIVAIVALLHSPLSALGIFLYYIVYQLIENYLIQPRLQANATNMSPLLVFMSVVVGVSFSGLLGGLVAIPLVGCIRVWVLDMLSRRQGNETPAINHEIKNANVGTK